MSRKLRALGLTVLALCGLTALMAASAQANWLEEGKEIHFQISTGTEQKNCKPKEPILAGGRALIKLYALTKGGVLLNVILFEQEGTKPFTTVTLPELCSLAETSDVTGSLVAECGILDAGAFVQEDCNKERVLHLLQAPAQTGWFESDLKGGHVEVQDKLKFGENAATLDGIADVELESKKTWAGHI